MRALLFTAVPGATWHLARSYHIRWCEISSIISYVSPHCWCCRYTGFNNVLRWYRSLKQNLSQFSIFLAWGRHDRTTNRPLSSDKNTNDNVSCYLTPTLLLLFLLLPLLLKLLRRLHSYYATATVTYTYSSYIYRLCIFSHLCHPSEVLLVEATVLRSVRLKLPPVGRARLVTGPKHPLRPVV